MNKKGISPLAFAVLLIVLVVGIGAIVTGVIRNYVDTPETVGDRDSVTRTAFKTNTNNFQLNLACQNGCNQYVSEMIQNDIYLQQEMWDKVIEDCINECHRFYPTDIK